MQDQLKYITVWLHLLCMVGAFGALLYHQLFLSTTQKADPVLGRTVNKAASILIAVGFLAGMLAYVLTIKLAASTGIEIESSAHMKIGIKFLILLGAGACLGISSGMIRKERYNSAGAQRLLALVLLATAALIGVWI